MKQRVVKPKSQTDKRIDALMNKGGGSSGAAVTNILCDYVSAQQEQTICATITCEGGTTDELLIYVPSIYGCCVAHKGKAKAFYASMNSGIKSGTIYSPSTNVVLSSGLLGCLISRAAKDTSDNNDLYVYGDECTYVSGGWNEYHLTGTGGNVIKNEHSITITTTGNTNDGYLASNFAVSIEAGKYLCIEYENLVYTQYSTFEVTAEELHINHWGYNTGINVQLATVGNSGTIAKKFTYSTAASLKMVVGGGASMSLDIKKIWISDTLPPGAVEV